MIDGALAGLHALVVTPFLPVPADAGQRKRVLQFHHLLRRMGCRITLLHYAGEQPWGWAHHQGLQEAAVSLVDELITVPAGPSFGRPAEDGAAHRLDEWADPLLDETVQRLLARRWFDMMVVNNVWLSYLLNHVPPGMVRIIETHDVFSDRAEALKAIGQPPDFFVCKRADEAWGWNRSDVVVAITDTEHEVIAPQLKTAMAVPLPYAEPMTPPRQKNYLHPGKVVFGFFGSAHPFNVHGLKALIQRLRVAARWAPIELVIAGEVGRSLTPEEAAVVTDLGYVRTPDDFYDAVDIFVSPLDHGSGLKIKVVEAISRGIPSIVTEHSAYGTGLVDPLVVPDVNALVRAMTRIALHRPALSDLTTLLGESQTRLQESVEAGAARLVHCIRTRQALTVFRYPELGLPASDPRLWILLGMLREVANRGPVALDLGDNAPEPAWLRYVHPRIRLFESQSGNPAAGPHGESRPRLKRPEPQHAPGSLVVFTNDPDYQLPGAVVHVHDGRWGSPAAPSHATHHVDPDGRCTDIAGRYPASTLPWWSESITWDPALQKRTKNPSQPYIALAAPDPDDARTALLIDALRLRAQMPVRIYAVPSGLPPSSLMQDVRTDPPTQVIELRQADATSPLGEWCEWIGIPYAPTDTASNALSAIHAPLRVGSAPTMNRRNWANFLERIYLQR